jgi:ankyrin repeat protein
LCKAILDADIKKVEELIKNGIDVNEKSSDGYSPLCIAAFWGYADIAKMLLEAKADVNATNKGTGWTPIHCAAFQGHGNVIRHLIEHQLDLTIKDSSGRY